MLPHLPVGHADARLRHQRPQPLIEAPDAPHPVVQEVHLPAPADFPQDGVPDQRVGILRHHRLHRDSLLRRGFQHAHVPDTCHAHVQRPRDRRRAQRQHVHLPLHVLDDFLVRHAEALLLVYDEQSQVLELHVFPQQPVGPDDQVDIPRGQLREHFALLRRRPEPAQEIHPRAGMPEAFHDRVVVLLHQDRRRGQQRHLLVVRNRLERGPQAHLGLAVAHVAAQESSHGNSSSNSRCHALSGLKA